MKRLFHAVLASALALAGAAAAAADKEIAVIVKTANSDFWQNVRKGATQAASELKGYTSSFQGAASATDLAARWRWSRTRSTARSPRSCWRRRIRKR